MAEILNLKKVGNMVKAKNYKDHLLKQLKKPEEAAAYLNAALKDDDPHVFLLALRDIAEAKGRHGIACRPIRFK